MYTTLYAVKDLPVFQNRMFDSPEAAQACARGDVVLAQDMRTGLIANRAFRPELMTYDADYQNEQAVSSTFRRHLQEVARICGQHLGKSLIEVGCGKGYFLEQLQADGYRVKGFDPTYEGNNPGIVKEYFTVQTGLHADGIVLRHVLEHVQDPIGFLSRIREANGGGGRIYIEVPCFDWICKRRAWFDVFYEHVNYFRLSDFERMFASVRSAGRLFGDQYLYVVADLASLREPVASQRPFEFPSDFLASVDLHARRLRERSSRVAVWGGASKGVLFSLFMQRAGVALDFVIDMNPAKHGRYLPATGIEVTPPEIALGALPRGAEIIVMNGNYLGEIRELTKGQYNYLTVDHANI